MGSYNICMYAKFSQNLYKLSTLLSEAVSLQVSDFSLSKPSPPPRGQTPPLYGPNLSKYKQSWGKA